MPYTDKYTKQNTSYQNKYDPAGRYAIFGQVKFGQALFGGNRKYYKEKFNKQGTSYTNKY